MPIHVIDKLVIISVLLTSKYSYSYIILYLDKLGHTEMGRAYLIYIRSVIEPTNI